MLVETWPALYRANNLPVYSVYIRLIEAPLDLLPVRIISRAGPHIPPLGDTVLGYGRRTITELN